LLSTAVFVAACTPVETVRISPSPTTAPTTAPATTRPPSPTATATASPARTPSPSPTGTAAPTTSPGSTPPTACPASTGGSPTVAPLVTAIRAAHHPGYDRFVIEFSGAAIPQYRIEVASSFTAPSGLPVRVDGNAFFSVRVAGAAHTEAGQRSYTAPDPYRPGLPLVREVKAVEDFEGVVIFGIGLERLACPAVSTVLGPPRLILDFPTPP
jgi:hypothetical protein